MISNVVDTVGKCHAFETRASKEGVWPNGDNTVWNGDASKVCALEEGTLLPKFIRRIPNERNRLSLNGRGNMQGS